MLSYTGSSLQLDRSNSPSSRCTTSGVLPWYRSWIKDISLATYCTFRNTSTSGGQSWNVQAHPKSQFPTASLAMTYRGDCYCTKLLDKEKVEITYRSSRPLSSRDPHSSVWQPRQLGWQGWSNNLLAIEAPIGIKGQKQHK